jgi:hypothetical protein
LGNFIPRLRLCINFDKSGFSYILGDFFTNSSGVDVMITSFGDFHPFSAKILAFSWKPMLWLNFWKKFAVFWTKHSNFLAIFLWPKYFQNHNIDPCLWVKNLLPFSCGDFSACLCLPIIFEDMVIHTDPITLFLVEASRKAIFFPKDKLVL